MVTIKTEDEIALLREGGKHLAWVLEALVKAARPGVSAVELDKLAERLVKEKGDTPSFLNYKAKGSKQSFPASLCVSVNDEVVHGLPKKGQVITEGDIVALDMGLIHEKMYLDSAVTVAVGKVDETAAKLIQITKDALSVGIKAARAGKHTGDIGYAIEQYVKKQGDYGIIRTLAGHGVGYAVHEEPFIPNFGNKGEGVSLKAGMVIAIEPMLTLGGEALTIDSDGFTFRTKDGSLSAHFEHTIAVTENGSEILTL